MKTCFVLGVFLAIITLIYCKQVCRVEEAFAENEADVSQGKTTRTFTSEDNEVEDCSEASQNACTLNGKAYLELSLNDLKETYKKRNILDEFCYSLGRTDVKGFLVVTSEVVGCPNTKKTIGKIYPKEFCCNAEGKFGC